MKSIVFVLVFSAAISAAYSFQCYVCASDSPNEQFTTEQCEKNLTKVNCSAPNSDGSCFRSFQETKTMMNEIRGCTSKAKCKQMKELCADETARKLQELTDCSVSCCVSDGDTPCNTFNKINNALAILADQTSILIVVLYTVFKYLLM